MNNMMIATVIICLFVVLIWSCLASGPRFLSCLLSNPASSILIWLRSEWAKGFVDAKTSQVRSKVSRRAWKRLQALEEAALADVIDSEDIDLEFVPLAYKYSRIARVELCCPKYSEANKKCAYHLIRKEMEARGVRKGQMVRAIHLAVKLTFVKDQDEIESDHLFSLLNPLVEAGK